MGCSLLCLVHVPCTPEKNGLSAVVAAGSFLGIIKRVLLYLSLSEALIINIRAINIFPQLKKLEKRMEGNSKGRMRNQRQKEGELVIAN